MGKPGFDQLRGRTFSVILLLAAVVIWGSTYVVTKGGVEDAPPMLFALLRYCAASLLLVPLALLRRRTKLPAPTPWGTLALMALTGVGLYYTGFNVALTYTSASQGALVQSSIPAVTAAMAVIFLRERLSVQRTLGIGLAVGGVLLIVAHSASDESARSPIIGNLLMVGTVVVWGMYTVLAKRVAHANPVVITTIVSVIGTLMLVPGALIEASTGATPPLSAETWLRIIYLGAFSSAVSYLLYNRALRDLDASQVGAFTNLAPVIGAVSGVLLLGEPITPLAIVGGVLVLAGVWLSSRR